METRARYALIGLFLLGVIAAGFGFVYWMENRGGFLPRTAYQVRFESSVPGLAVGSAVLFNGIRVGEVTELQLDAEHPKAVLAIIAVDSSIPVRADTRVDVEVQGLTGGAVVALRGGSSTAPIIAPKDGELPTLVADPNAGGDWTQAARNALQRIDNILAENSEALHSAIENIDIFAQALGRNSDKVDGIIAGLERMLGGSKPKSQLPIYDLAAARDFPPLTSAPSWQLLIPEPSTLLAFNTDKIQMQPAEGETLSIADAQWSDNLPLLFQEKVLQSFENAGYSRFVSRPREGFEAGYQLLFSIRRFVLATEGAPTAEVEFEAKILGPEGKIIDARTFKTSAPAKGTDAPQAAEALNEAFRNAATELVPWAAGVVTAALEEPEEPETESPTNASPT